jgi:hypothetical protein
MKVKVPPSKRALQAMGLLWSSVTVRKSKSARQARGGVLFEMIMFVCSTSGREVGIKTKSH